MSQLIAIALLLGCLLLALVCLSRVRHGLLKRSAQAVFDRTFGAFQPRPTFKMSYSYGVPTFNIAFASQNDFDRARTSGLTHSFVASIQDLCRGRGSREHPYEASRAVEFSWLTASFV